MVKRNFANHARFAAVLGPLAAKFGRFGPAHSKKAPAVKRQGQKTVKTRKP